MKTNKVILFFDKKLVGTVAFTPSHKVAFEYCDDWLQNGFSSSPFSLPLKRQVFIPQKDYFHGLFGVFSDSLPDAWGQLLLSRLLKNKEAGKIPMILRICFGACALMFLRTTEMII